MRILLTLVTLLIASMTFAQKGGKAPLKGYDKIYPYNKKGWAKVEKGGKVGYIDRTGEPVIECIYDEIYPFDKGKAKVVKNGKFGILREDGSILVEAKYDYIGPFVNGLAIVAIKDKRGLIDENGEPVVDVE